MYKEFYAGHALLGWPLFALFFFVAVFTWVVVREARRGGARHDGLAALPLSDDDRPRANAGGDASKGAK